MSKTKQFVIVTVKNRLKNYVLNMKKSSMKGAW